MVCLSPCLCYGFDFVNCHGEYHQRRTKKEIPACVARRHVSNLQLLDVQGTGLLRAFVQCPGSAGLSNTKHSGLLSARCPSLPLDSAGPEASHWGLTRIDRETLPAQNKPDLGKGQHQALVLSCLCQCVGLCLCLCLCLCL